MKIKIAEWVDAEFDESNFVVGAVVIALIAGLTVTIRGCQETESGRRVTVRQVGAAAVPVLAPAPAPAPAQEVQP